MKTIEAPICSVSTLPKGQMKQFSIGDRPILVANHGGTFYAIAAHCSHAGAPLENGVLSGDRVICPWHNARASSPELKKEKSAHFPCNP